MRQVLQVKGRKELEGLFCDDCEIHEWRFPFTDNVPPFDHPFMFLHSHASRNHKTSLLVCFYWTWEAGGGPYKDGEITEFTGCRT